MPTQSEQYREYLLEQWSQAAQRQSEAAMMRTRDIYQSPIGSILELVQSKYIGKTDNRTAKGYYESLTDPEGQI